MNPLSTGMIVNQTPGARTVLGVLLVVGLLWASLAGAQDPNSTPVRTYSGPVSMIEKATPGTVARESLEIPHTIGGPVASVPVEVVRMSEILGAAPADLMSGPRFHIQGDPAEDGGVDGAGIEGSSPPGPESDLPTANRGVSYLNYEAIDSTGWIPPDTVVAAGLYDIVEATNSGFAIYSKTGREIQGYTTFASFFGTSEFLYDPRIIYNPEKDRYVMLILQKNSNSQTSHVRIAISQSAWADGDWWRWIFDVEHSDGLDWMDYATLGADDFGIYFAGNMFNWAGGFRWAKARTLNPAMWTGGASNGWEFWDLEFSSGDGAFGLQFADPHSVNSNEESYFVNTWAGWGSEVGLWTVTGDRTSSPGFAVTTITGLPTYYALGENVDQPDSSADIAGGDSRVMNAKYTNRRVFFTLGTDVNDDAALGGWYTAKLNSDDGTLEWNHTLWGADQYYTYPALTLEGTTTSANIGVIGTWVNGTDRYASTIAKIYDDQPNAETGDFFVFASGVGSYEDRDSDDRNRWGDYSGADYDWACGHLVGAAEFADATNSWSTQVLMTTFDAEPSCSRLDITSPTGSDSILGGHPHTIEWTASALPVSDSVYVYYSMDDGVTWAQIATGISPGTTSIPWTTPVFDSTGEGKIFVGSWDGSAYTVVDRSDFNFIMTGCVDDGYEEDDSCYGSPIAIGATQNHTACDVDWMYFNPVPGGLYRIETSNLLNGADTIMTLQESCGDPVAVNDDGGVGFASLIDYRSVTGNLVDIEIEIFAGRYAADKGFTIDVTCLECCDGACFIFADGFESGGIGAWGP